MRKIICPYPKKGIWMTREILGQIPGTELRITLEPCSNSQFEWPTPSVQEMYHFIRVEGA